MLTCGGGNLRLITRDKICSGVDSIRMDKLLLIEQLYIYGHDCWVELHYFNQRVRLQVQRLLVWHNTYSFKTAGSVGKVYHRLNKRKYKLLNCFQISNSDIDLQLYIYIIICIIYTDRMYMESTENRRVHKLAVYGDHFGKLKLIFD